MVDHGVDLLGYVSMAGIVWYAARGGISPVGRFLESRLMVWLGGISYGQLKDRFPYLPKAEVIASAPVGRNHDRHDVDAVAPLDDKYLV